MSKSSYEYLGDALADLDKLGQITNDGQRTRDAERIKIAMLVDIAASLRILADAAPVNPRVADVDVADDVAVDLPLEVGDSIGVKGDTHPTRDVGTIESIGSTEGAEFAIVAWAFDPPVSTRVWLNLLERVEPGEGDFTEDARDAFTTLKKGKGKKGKSLTFPLDGA